MNWMGRILPGKCAHVWKSNFPYFSYPKILGINLPNSHVFDLTSHIVTSSISHIYEDNINTSIIDQQQCIAQNFLLTCTMQSLNNHTPLFMIEFKKHKILGYHL